MFEYLIYLFQSIYNISLLLHFTKTELGENNWAKQYVYMHKKEISIISTILWLKKFYLNSLCYFTYVDK